MVSAAGSSRLHEGMLKLALVIVRAGGVFFVSTHHHAAKWTFCTTALPIRHV
jgi:hypothetical protein